MELDITHAAFDFFKAKALSILKQHYIDSFTLTNQEIVDLRGNSYFILFQIIGESLSIRDTLNNMFFFVAIISFLVLSHLFE